MLIKVRDYLESFIENNKNKPLHLLDVQIHMNKMDEISQEFQDYWEANSLKV